MELSSLHQYSAVPQILIIDLTEMKGNKGVDESLISLFKDRTDYMQSCHGSIMIVVLVSQSPFRYKNPVNPQTSPVVAAVTPVTPSLSVVVSHWPVTALYISTWQE
jgi:hypothetical protein